MAKENYIRLRGIVQDKPKITTNQNGQFAFATIVIARPYRSVGDHISYAHMDNPKIMTRDPEIIAEMEQWEANDIVDIKGFLSSKQILKGSFCPHCRTKNTTFGSFVFVVPNFVEKLGFVTDEDDSQEYLVKHREISNVVKLFGTLINGPKKFRTYAGLPFTQYQIGVNRKFRIKEDDPNVRSDYPWVKSYGDRARMDKLRLQKGSEIYIDGCLQARYINRKAYCGQARDEQGNFLKHPNGEPIVALDVNGNPTGCGKEYYWNDQTLEVVPFDVEFVANYLSEEEAIIREEEQRKQSEKDKGEGSVEREVFDTATEEDLDNGIDTEDSDGYE